MFPGAAGGFQRANHVLLRPRSPAADFAGVDAGGAQRRVIAAEVTDGGSMKPRVVLLNRAAVERLVIHRAAAQFERDRVAIPPAVTTDFICVQARRGEGAVPSAEQARLEAGEGGLAQL